MLVGNYLTSLITKNLYSPRYKTLPGFTNIGIQRFGDAF